METGWPEITAGCSMPPTLLAENPRPLTIGVVAVGADACVGCSNAVATIVTRARRSTRP